MEGSRRKPVSIRTLIRNWLMDEEPSPPAPEPTIKASTPIRMPEEIWERSNHLRGKTGLVLQSLLHIHESIEDAEAMQGYEGLPLQVEKIYWEVWGVLAKNPDLTTPDEVLEIWIDEYAAPDFHA